MSYNWLLLIGLTVVQFFIGALWFSVIFQKQWLVINHPDKLPTKEELASEGSKIGPLLVIQFVIQFVANIALYALIKYSDMSWQSVGFIIWFGINIPVTIQNILWVGKQTPLKITQALIIISELFVLTMLAAYTLGTWG